MQKYSEVQTMTKKFIIEESFVSYADIEIYADNQDEALAKYHRGDFSPYDYDVSDFTDTHTLLGVREEEPVNSYQGA